MRGGSVAIQGQVRPKRKAIPDRIKREVLERQNHHCDECKMIFIVGEKIQFDHRPAIISRPVNADGTDYVPPQLDPVYIDATHVPCHLKRTIGRIPGAEKTVTTKGSDIWLKKKFDRLEGRTKTKPKQKIPARKNPWPKRKMRS